MYVQNTQNPLEYNNLLSIVIPVYNNVLFLNECLDSIKFQEYKNYEIIVIDDGSSSEANLKIKEIISKYNDITLIVKDNDGVSSARNLGLQHAKGRYITFLDSDDKVHPLMFSDLIEHIIKNECKAAFCDFLYFKEDKIFPSGFFVAQGVVEKKDIIDNFVLPTIGSNDNIKDFRLCHASCCTAVFDVDFLRMNHICFENLKYSEDLIFKIQFLLKANSVYCSNKSFYYYRINEKSVTNSFDVLRFQKTKDAYLKLYDMLSNSEIDTTLWYPRLKYWFMGQVSVCIKQLILNNTPKSYVQEIRNDKIVDEILKDFNARQPFHLKVFCFLFKNNMFFILRSITKLYCAVLAG